MEKEYHFYNEMLEQPRSIQRTLAETDSQIQTLAAQYAGQIKQVLLIGCGDPFMLGQAAVYALENWAGVKAEAVEAAEFSLYRHGLLDANSLVIAITSSGNTVKVLDAVRLARQAGAKTLALTNLSPSPICDEVDDVIQTRSTPSNSFPTVTTTIALAALYNLTLHWSQASKSLPVESYFLLQQELMSLPQSVARALTLETRMGSLAQQLKNAPIYTFLGSGPNWATAQLGAAKMKEISQSRSEAANLEEYAHLFSLSIQPEDPVFLITADAPIDERNRMVAKFIQGMGGRLFVVGAEKLQAGWEELDIDYIPVADHSEMFGPVLAWIPLQMFAYHVSLQKGCNPDKPLNRGELEPYIQKIIYTSLLDGWEKR
ncbi:MAG: SIS domain-containing protein [Anaerolineaceae bacterium]|nr:SIS domain-containing protein [Anaerolineaceae bacterium]